MSSAKDSVLVPDILRFTIPTSARLIPANVPLVERTDSRNCRSSDGSLMFFSICQLTFELRGLTPRAASPSKRSGAALNELLGVLLAAFALAQKLTCSCVYCLRSRRGLHDFFCHELFTCGCFAKTFEGFHLLCGKSRQ